MSLPSEDRVRAIRAKLARGDELDPSEQIDWMDTNLVPTIQPEPPQKVTDSDGEETEQHEVRLRRNALNVIVIERGEMFGTAIPFSQDISKTMQEVQRMISEVYVARRHTQKNAED